MGDFFTKTLQGRTSIRYRSIVLGKSKANEPKPPRSVLDPKVSRVADTMGQISKLAGGAPMRVKNRKLNIQGKDRQ